MRLKFSRRAIIDELIEEAGIKNQHEMGLSLEFDTEGGFTIDIKDTKGLDYASFQTLITKAETLFGCRAIRE